MPRAEEQHAVHRTDPPVSRPLSKELRTGSLRHSGIELIGDIPWGTHFCHLYQTSDEQLEILVPYFRQGLLDNEYCLWITCDPISVDDAVWALRRVVPDLQRRLDEGQLHVLDCREWYFRDGHFDAEIVLERCVAHERAAQQRGYDGLRIAGDAAWLVPDAWQAFCGFESHVHRTVGAMRALVACSYSARQCGAYEVFDLVGNHEFALIKRPGRGWEVIESPEHRHAAEARREVEWRQKAILDTIPEPAWLKSADGLMLAVNAAWCQVLGQQREDVLGKSIHEIFPAELAAKLHAQDLQVMQSRTRMRFDDTMIDSLGRESWFETITSPLIDADGMVVGIAGLARDITARRQAEAERHDLAQQRQLALDAARMGWWHYDLVTGRSSWDDRYCEIFGVVEHERPNEEILARLHPEDLQDVLARVDAALDPANPQPYSAEYRVHHPDGSTRWVEAHGQAIFEGDGPTRRAVSLIGTVADITERKRTEHDKLQMERRLLHAQKLESLGVLAGGIAHDFNNILSAILGYTELLKRSLPATPQAHEDLEVIRQAAQRATELTRQMLAYAGKASFPVAPIDLSRVVEEARKFLEVSVTKKALLVFDLPQNLPAMAADATRIHQVVLNLVTNASDALGDQVGRIDIATSTAMLTHEDLAACHHEAGLSPGPYIRLTVCDNGCGMDADTIPKIFDPFFTTKATGHGLGLAAVQGIVRAHRGAIRLTSAPGEGTTFDIFFPASPRSIVPEKPNQSALQAKGGGLVLVADDELMVRNLARRALELAGFTVLTAVDGEEAVQIFREHQSHLTCVLLDLTMPKLDGLETLRLIRESAPDLRAVLCSGYPAEAASRRFGGLGVSTFVQKPFQIDALIAAVSGVTTQATSPP